MNLVPLYLMTEYSMMQSSCRITETIMRAKQDGYQSLAMCDDGNLHGAIKFYRKCVENQIKPIIGLKIKYRLNDVESSLLLYAMNNFGYQNLMKIASHYKINQGMVDFSYLQQTSIGLLAILPSEESVIYQYLPKNEQALIQHIRILESTYDYVYLGIAKTSALERQMLTQVKQFALQNQFSCVALHPVSYLDARDIEVYQVLKAMKSGTLSPLGDGDDNRYFVTPEEFALEFREDIQLLANTEKISSLCSVNIRFEEYHLPRYQEDIDANQYLRSLCLAGLKKRLRINQNPNWDTQEYFARLNYELDTIQSMGFSDYFLIVWDFVRFAKKEGIYVGPGRGSAPASLVSYSLGITDIDPIQHGLLFERFLNKERITMPDIDIDFPDDERDRVIRYVGEKYGTDHVAHIVTFGTFALRSAIRDVARVVKLSTTRLNEILKQVSDQHDKLSELVKANPRLQELMENYEDIGQVIRVAMKIEGLPRNTSTHAAGIIMTKHSLVTYTPLDNGLNGIYQTQYEAEDLELLGILKMDFLGLRNLTNIKKTVDRIKQNNPDFELPKDFNDRRTFQLIAGADTDGVFQLESTGMKRVLKELRVSNFNDIASAIALYRPGPMEMIPTFINRKLGREKVSYPHKDLEPILKNTYGTIVYQDQILLIAWKFAGYSLGQADVLRRAVSKKKREVLEAERIHFIASSLKQGYSEEVASEIYDYIVKFANYGFNKAHAVSYAVIAYQTAFLKANYYIYYLATLMSSVIGVEGVLSNYLTDALRHQIKILPPHINHSGLEFEVKDNVIIFPITSILGLGLTKAEKIIEERKNGRFASFEDFLIRIKDILPESLIENVIYSSALDIFGITKKAMIENYKKIIRRIQYRFVEDLLDTKYDTEELNYGTLLEAEKRVLGLNLKYNFFHQFQHLYQNPNIKKIKDASNGQTVYVLGLIKRIKEIKTKKGETMAFAMISDDTGEIELTLFTDLYTKNVPLNHGQVILVGGRVEERKGHLQILVSELTKK